jgi:monovalent cation:H+ antiporter, CPA1 family
MKLWQIVALVIAGVIYGEFQPGQLTYAFGAATLYVLLPALLFEAAWNLHFRAMQRAWLPIATLAVPGVLLSALLIAGALAVVRVPIATGMLAGAILAATDPIAVVAVFKRVRVPLLLRTIVECEALFNDAVAVALYAAVLTGSLFGGAVAAIGGSLGGIALGIGVAWVAARLLHERGNAALQIAATLLCAYGSFFAAQRLGGSGLFAAIACGIALRRFERTSVSLTVAADVEGFWELLALLANAVVFFLVGAALDVAIVTTQPLFVIATLAGIFIARFAVAGMLLPAGFPRAWLDVVRVAGMRGALSLALALALPPAIPYRGAIVAATFAVALATIISSVFTVPPVVKRTIRTEAGALE